MGYYLKGIVFAEQGKYVDAINCYESSDNKLQPDVHWSSLSKMQNDYLN